MKTTELVVEQVFVGLLVLAIFTLPSVPGNLERLPEDTSRLLAIAAALGLPALGLAYLLGVVFDRFADTLLSRIEMRQRLRFAVEQDENRRRAAATLPRHDPFPEDLLRIRVMREGESLGDWMEYLRTRIRITRSLAVFLPALTLSAALAILGEPWPLLPPIGLGLVALIYVLSFAATLRDNENEDTKLPKTWHRDLERRLEELPVAREPVVRGALGVTGLGGFVLAAAALHAQLDDGLAVVAILLAGAALSALSVWSWRRITKTFMNLLEACGREGVGNSSRGEAAGCARVRESGARPAEE